MSLEEIKFIKILHIVCMMKTRAMMTVYVCSHPDCGNRDLYVTLQQEVSWRSLPVIVEERGCLGECSYLQRAEVRLPGGELIQYAGTDVVKEGKRVFTAVGDDPLKTIIEANLPKTAEAKK